MPEYEESWEPEEGGSEIEEEEPEESEDGYAFGEAEDELGEAIPARRIYSPSFATGSASRPVFGRPASGLQYATVSTPAGQARITLPKRVATVAELNRSTQRLARVVAAQGAQLRRLGAQAAATQRATRRLQRSSVRAANASLLVLLTEQVKDVVLDVVALRNPGATTSPAVRAGSNGSGRHRGEPHAEASAPPPQNA